MKSVFLLQHSYEVDGVDEVKIIGIYSSKKKAEKVIEKYKVLPGFNKYMDSFHIDEYPVDTDHWNEGFYSLY